ncbi:MAG TPA: hypothetical protein VMZ25_00175 [Terriglobales bacterium]|nr:hypothetical protein [Terriglobales bacterium]
MPRGKRNTANHPHETFDGVNVAGFATDLKERTSEAIEKMQAGLGDLEISEATVPDAFKNSPKFISPSIHAWLDVAVTGYFLGVGAWCAMRGKKGAATAAFVNAGMVAGVSLMTDYHGTGNRPINFKMHGTLDAVQAATAAMAPTLHGFAGEPESSFFYGQAANEVAVIAATDWDAGMKNRRRNLPAGNQAA